MRAVSGDANGAVKLWRAGALDGVPHGFAGRHGGVSTGDVASLNCGLGSGDDPALVTENRRRAADAVLPGAAMVGLYQVHGRECARALTAWADEDRPQADALVTERPDIILSILTADCVPVLFADAEAGVIGAAHAGWKGAFAGVTDSTIDAMLGLGAHRHRIAGAIGPAIARASYEVDRPVLETVLAADPENERFFIDGRADHWQFDVPGYVAHRLAAYGIGRVEMLDLDTYANPDDFYSYRRATHLGEPNYGRQISMIGLAR